MAHPQHLVDHVILRALSHIRVAEYEAQQASVRLSNLNAHVVFFYFQEMRH